MPSHAHARRTLRPARILSVLVCLIAMAAIAAPAANAKLTYYGAQVHSMRSWDVSVAQMNQDLDSLQAAGANVLRDTIQWSTLESSPGHYDATYLARVDAFMAGAQQRGIKVIANIACTPSWASSGGAWNDVPTDPAGYGSIARFVTARYGSELAAVEAWNEPNWQNNIVAPDVPAAYAAMLKSFYTGAKQGDADVPVLMGSTAYADLPFIKALWSHGVQGFYDGISIHPYADGAAPDNTSVTHSFLGGIQAMHAAQQAAGDNTPLWITEFGWPVGSSQGANTEQQSADYLLKAFNILQGLNYVTGASAYQLRDMATDPSNPEDNFGLLHQDFSPRPAYAAFKTAMTQVASGAPGVVVPLASAASTAAKVTAPAGAAGATTAAKSTTSNASTSGSQTTKSTPTTRANRPVVKHPARNAKGKPLAHIALVAHRHRHTARRGLARRCGAGHRAHVRGHGTRAHIVCLAIHHAKKS